MLCGRITNIRLKGAFVCFYLALSHKDANRVTSTKAKHIKTITQNLDTNLSNANLILA